MSRTTATRIRIQLAVYLLSVIGWLVLIHITADNWQVTFQAVLGMCIAAGLGATLTLIPRKDTT